MRPLRNNTDQPITLADGTEIPPGASIQVHPDERPALFVDVAPEVLEALDLPVEDPAPEA